MKQTKPDINPELKYSRSAVARRLEISYNTIDRAVFAGTLKCEKLSNRSVLFLGADVLNFWETKRY